MNHLAGTISHGNFSFNGCVGFKWGAQWCLRNEPVGSRHDAAALRHIDAEWTLRCTTKLGDLHAKFG